MNLHEKLVELRKEVPYLQKDTKGYNYVYVSGATVLEKLQPKMNELGILLFTETSPIQKETLTTENDKGKMTSQTQVYASFRFTWIDAANPTDRIALDFCGAGQDSDISKALGKMLTYSERYFLLKTFNIPTDKDDPDAHQGEDPRKRSDPPRQQTPKTGPQPDAVEEHFATPTREEALAFIIPIGNDPPKGKKGLPASELSVEELASAIAYCEKTKKHGDFLAVCKSLELPF